MKRFKTILVENDSSAIEDLFNCLGENPILDIKHTVGTRAEAIDLLLREPFEISLLDIDLPDGTCFDIIDRVRASMGEVIFCTSYGSQFILRMIHEKPISYLEKPYSEEKVREMNVAIADFFNAKTYPQEFIELSLDNTKRRFFIKKKDILYIEHRRRESIFHFRAQDGVYTTAIEDGQKMQLLLNRLNDKFVQCHRNYIINVDYLTDYFPEANGDCIVKMPDNKEKNIPISKNYKAQVFTRKGIS